MPESIPAQISRILAGDREAAGWLYDTFAPRLLRRLGQRFAAHGLDPQDLLQDTFLYVLGGDGRVLERFRARAADERDLEHLLWNAACGIASNRRRSVLRHPAAALDPRALPPTAGGEGRAVARDALKRLGDCLFAGGERPYLYFQLRYLDGHTPAEIADITGWSRKATYKLKQTLDQALDRCVEELGIQP